MQHVLAAPPTGAREFSANPAFNVLIAYEDFAAGKHAKQTYDFLAEQLGPICCCTNQMWKFGVLHLPKLRDIAVQDARLADILIVSCSTEELPESVKDWLEEAVCQAHNALALVALFEPSRPGAVRSRQTRNYLAGLARRARLEFFAQPDVWAEHQAPSRFLLTGAEPGEVPLASLVTAVQPDTSFPRWGINE